MGEEDGVVRIIKAYTNLNKASTINQERSEEVSRLEDGRGIYARSHVVAETRANRLSGSRLSLHHPRPLNERIPDTLELFRRS